MIYDFTDIIERPIEKVVEAFRDSLPNLAPYLPNILAIETLEKRAEGEIQEIVNRWYSSWVPPAPIRKMIKIDELSWTDYATWLIPENKVVYRLVFDRLDEIVSVNGETAFFKIGDKTQVRYTGHISVNLPKLETISSLLSRTIGDQISKMIMTVVRPNMFAVNRGVEALLT